VSISEVIVALYWRALSIEELGVERGITTVAAFRAVREAMTRGWVEPLGMEHSQGEALRLYRLTPEGCVKLAPMIQAPRSGPVI
jgi:hypothetical protein